MQIWMPSATSLLVLKEGVSEWAPDIHKFVACRVYPGCRIYLCIYYAGLAEAKMHQSGKQIIIHYNYNRNAHYL